MLGILPFLIQWIALGQLGSQDYYFQHVHQPASYVPKSHWTLLNEFKQLPEEEIDHFLPQICNMILDRESLRDDDLYDYFESVIEQKCSDCFSFGTRVCGVLKATQQAPSESLFRSILTSTSASSAQNQRVEERLRALQERAEYATAYGFHLPMEQSALRSAYYRDYQFMLDTLARLGTELKSYPVPLRNVHLRHALSQYNALLSFRMASQGSVSSSDTPLTDFQAFTHLSAQNIASLLPEAAQFSLHLPLHRTHDRACRILRFVESECEVLPSKERCPYVVVVEVLEQPYKCSSSQVYTQGRVPRPQSVLRVHQGQVMYSGEPLTIENEHDNMYGDRSGEVYDLNAQVVAQSIDERQSSAHSASGRANFNTQVFSVPRSPTRGKLLSTRLNNQNRYASSVNSGSSGATGVSGTSSIGYSRRARRYRAAVRPLHLDEEEYVEHSSGSDSRAGSSIDIGGDSNSENSSALQEELLQLQEAYNMYDDAYTQTASGNSNANTDAKTAGDSSVSESESVRLFARPDVVLSILDDHDFRQVHAEGEGEEGVVCVLDDTTSDSDTSGGAGAGADRGADGQNSTSRTGQKDSAIRTDSIRGGHTPPINNNHNHQSRDQFNTHKLHPHSNSNTITNSNAPYKRRPSVRFNRRPGHFSDSISRTNVNNDKSVTSTAASSPTTATTRATSTSTSTSVSPSWAERRASLRAQSPFGHLPGWDARAFIVKSGEDLRKEVLAMQLMEFCQKVFELEGLDIYLRPYQILTTGAQAGLVEFLQGADSIDKIKKILQAQSQTLAQAREHAPQQSQTQSSPPSPYLTTLMTSAITSTAPPAAASTTSTTVPTTHTLKQHFERRFGPSYSFFHARAVKNFVRSLVGYSLLTYIVQVKDRHNGNILLDEEGHLLHIDFGFILGDSPGFNINFESAPFKLTAEYIEVLGGLESESFKLFQDLFLRGFLALQRHVDGISSIVQLFYGDKRKAAAEGVRSRLLFPQSQSDILSLVGDSLDNWRTKQYDWYQERTNNIQV